MRRACIDIGSNTTRLLVAECQGDELLEVHQQRVFTRIGRSIGADGRIAPEKFAEVIAVVSAQARDAAALGCHGIYAVATAAVRRAANGEALAAGITAACGVPVRILTGEQEARLAFLGAAGTLPDPPPGVFGVVDVGGGSTELIAGTAADGVQWCESYPIGSGELADRILPSGRPSEERLAQARRHVAQIMQVSWPPPPVSQAVAVGGSATSLGRLAGPVLDRFAFAQAFSLLRSESTVEVSRRFALARERVELLPGALLILERAVEVFGVPLQVARGGLREGVLLEATAGH